MSREAGHVCHQKYFVYCLLDPRDGKPRYVGLTINTQKRLADHICGNGGVRYVHDWILELLLAGIVPSISIIQECDGWWASRIAESRWISRLSKRFGSLILNRSARMDRNDVRQLDAMRREIVKIKGELQKKIAAYTQFICERSGVEDVGFFKLPEPPKRKYKSKAVEVSSTDRV